MRPTLRILPMLAILVLLCGEVSADTGTYQILDYRVKLAPKSDGTVEIEYFQRWMVTGGNVPWVTVGMPNSNFAIVPNSNKGNATRVYAANTGDWSGVRVVLDRNYRPSEKFEIGFTIIENRLFYADGDNYRLVFWPGWYDRAQTDSLRIEVLFYAKLDTVKADPRPTRIEGQSMIWERKNLAAGEKFKISVSIPRTFMPGRIITRTIPSVLSETPWPTIIFVVILFAFFIIILIKAMRYRFSDSYGSGPRIYYGGGHGSRGGSGHKGGGIFGGGGGGFGGRSFSCVCACACVGCACACACAGGGAAGCERKLSQRCALCRQCKTKRRCPVWKGAAI